jgi:hypothetical protein
VIAGTHARAGAPVEERRRLLDDHAVVQAALEELGHLEVGDDRAFRNRLLIHDELYTTHSIDVRRRYERGLPVVALSRCPFTGEVLHHSIDHHGIDGLWWDHQSPVRPVETVPATFVGLTGALRLGGPLEYTPFLVKPGPAAPFVVPPILEAGAVAVLSQIAIGAHTGFAVVYFAESPPDVALFDEWGRGSHRRYRDAAAVGWNHAADPATMDFDLAPWIAREQVVWIEPGDDDLQVWSGTDDCPYLDLPGPRDPQRFQYGRAWHAGRPT